MADSRRERIRLFIELRSHLRCEYCLRPQPITGVAFHIEHVIPRVRGGKTNLENLALACASCNYRKSDRSYGIDPKTKQAMRLFNPRLDSWNDHFRWSRSYLKIIGKTPVGRATVATLDLNRADQQAFRRLWKKRFRDLFPFEVSS